MNEFFEECPPSSCVEKIKTSCRIPEISFGAVGIRYHFENPCDTHDEYQFEVKQALEA